MLKDCAANKSDLAEQRAVTEEEGREASEAHNCAHYAETSAKTSDGIEGEILLLPSAMLEIVHREIVHSVTVCSGAHTCALDSHELNQKHR
jgi:hypothetical protein